MTRVRISATSPVVEAGLRNLLEQQMGMETARSGEIADVLLSDRDWSEIPQDPPSVPVVMLSHQPPTSLIQQGARGVLPPNSTGTEIRAALEAAAAGLMVLPFQAPTYVPASMGTVTQNAVSDAGSDSLLTAREKEVLGLLAEGVGNKEIAWRLHITEHTVKFHVSSLMTKLAAGSRTEAVTQGIRRGYVSL